MGVRRRLWLWWHVRVRPSRLQRLHNAGDPTGEVRAFADKIINEMRHHERGNKPGQHDGHHW